MKWTMISHGLDGSVMAASKWVHSFCSNCPSMRSSSLCIGCGEDYTQNLLGRKAIRWSETVHFQFKYCTSPKEKGLHFIRSKELCKEELTTTTVESPNLTDIVWSKAYSRPLVCENTSPMWAMILFSFRCLLGFSDGFLKEVCNKYPLGHGQTV